MKFQKGLLSDLGQQPARPRAAVSSPAIDEATSKTSLPDLEPAPPAQKAAPSPIVETSAAYGDDHLFETLEEEKSGARKYVKVFAAVVVLVIAGGIAAVYFTMPGVGDQVRVPAGVELAVRDHFLTKEKRTATDIVFYQCDGYFAAKVGVETRTDLPNPVFQLDTYSARIVPAGDQLQIAAAPIAEDQQFAPCK